MHIYTQCHSLSPISMTRNEWFCVSVCTDLHYDEGLILCVCVCVTMFMHVCSRVFDMAHLWTVATPS